MIEFVIGFAISSSILFILRIRRKAYDRGYCDGLLFRDEIEEE